jgi:hypothetical protein
MSWVMTSKRFRGSATDSPRVEFCIGAIKIAEILMLGKNPWKFYLSCGFDSESTIDTFDSFGEALKALHKALNSPPPEGFEIFQGSKK